MRLLFSVLLLLAAGGASQARQLHWRALDVDARLDADGVLHVVERHEMVFDGAWNGGERVFDVRPGQKLRLRRVLKIDPASSQETVLRRGDLDEVDNWNWESRHVLRWRSRRPTDPPFSRQTLIYALEYELARILRQRGDAYRLDHDFAFADRFGTIETFTLDLELDPAWQPPSGFERRLEIANLTPGRGVLMTADLGYSGAGSAAAVERPVADHKVLGLFFAVLCLLGLKVSDLWRHEHRQGRFEVPDLPDPVHRGWLNDHLFDLLPEEAGALWDQKVGASEVAAVIARMVAEEKLASRVTDEGRWWRRPTLELELRVERSSLEGYERGLIDKLFFDDRTRIDTRALQKHYKSTGFDPAKTLRPGLEARLETLSAGTEKPPKANWRPTGWLLVLFLAAVVLEAVMRGTAALGPLAAALGVFLPVPTLWAYLAAATYRARATRSLLGWIGFLLPLGLLVAGCAAICWSGAGGRELLADLRPGIFAMVAIATIALAIGNSVLNTARTRESRKVVARRQILAAARAHLKGQLGEPIPDLDDSWFPYLLAFGLSRQADAWARTNGPASTSSRAAATSWSGPAAPSWTGGGAAFGGAGATGAWTAAATGMASGVSPPSSSGSGGSGGGSSGGGGGGGW